MCARMAGSHRLRWRGGLWFVVQSVVIGAPIIAVIVLGLEVGPFLRLLAAHIDLVPFVIRWCYTWGPVITNRRFRGSPSSSFREGVSLTWPCWRGRHSRMYPPSRQSVVGSAKVAFTLSRVVNVSAQRRWALAGGGQQRRRWVGTLGRHVCGKTRRM